MMFTTMYALPLEASPATQKKHSDVEKLPSRKDFDAYDYLAGCGYCGIAARRTVPLDLQAELQLHFDRIAIAYRKWLRELGLTFGKA